MPLKVCLAPGCNALTPAPRCPAHTRHNRSPVEARRRAEVVAVWVASHGYVCPGWGRGPHPSDDLTADHITPVARGGREDGPLRVLCRSCNGRKADRE